MFNYKKFGETVRFLRKRKGYSVVKFALELKISNTYLSQIERGEKIPSVEVVVWILNALNLSFDDSLTFLNSNNTLETDYLDLLDVLDDTDCEYVYDLMMNYVRKDDNNS